MNRLDNMCVMMWNAYPETNTEAFLMLLFELQVALSNYISKWKRLFIETQKKHLLNQWNNNEVK